MEAANGHYELENILVKKNIKAAIQKYQAAFEKNWHFYISICFPLSGIFISSFNFEIFPVKLIQVPNISSFALGSRNFFFTELSIYDTCFLYWFCYKLCICLPFWIFKFKTENIITSIREIIEALLPSSFILRIKILGQLQSGVSVLCLSKKQKSVRKVIINFSDTFFLSTLYLIIWY